MAITDDAGFIDISGDGGLLKKIIKEGEGGSPQTGDEVTAHYTGTLQDGTKFDSSRDKQKAFKFAVGTLVTMHTIHGRSQRNGERDYFKTPTDQLRSSKYAAVK